MSTEFTTVGVIGRDSHDQIYWTNWYEPNTSRVISPKFRLPMKNDDVDCHFFVDRTQKKFGITNVSQHLGTVVISGQIAHYSCSRRTDIDIVKQELKDEISFNFLRLHRDGIVFHVSEAYLCSQIKTPSAVGNSSCSSRFFTDMENQPTPITNRVPGDPCTK